MSLLLCNYLSRSLDYELMILQLNAYSCMVICVGDNIGIINGIQSETNQHNLNYEGK